MSKIIAHHLKGRAEVSIYDPTSGSASLETSLLKELTKTMKINKIKVYAQELIENTYNLTRMNLVMRDVLPDNLIVRNGDTLAQDWPFFEDGDDAERRINTYRLETVDACCSNPPYSQAWDTTKADSDARFKDYGIAPKSKADYAFLLHNLYHLANDGIMAIVLPHGVLFRGGEEENIRRELIERSNIETIIGLPANIFFGTGIPTIIMILKKQRESDDILFVDASKGFIKDGNKNRLQAKDVQRIVDTVLTRNPDPKESDFARLVSKEEIVEKNEYNLNISRYVKPKKEIKNYDLYATMYGGIPNYEINDLFKPWENFRKLKSELFEPISEKYSCLKTTDVSNVLNSNSEIESFRGQYFSVIDNIVNLINDEIVLKAENININDIEVPLYNKIRGYMNDLPIINYYDIYQIVSNQWNNISWDLELIQNDGLLALNIVKPNMIKKKKKNSKDLIDVQDGWLGNILPFDLIQEEYFKDDKTRIEELSEKLKSLDNEKQETIDAIDVNDKASILKENSEEVESAKLNAEIKRVKKEIKKGFEVEEDSYEALIMKIEGLNASIKKTKDELKTLKVLIEENTKSKIESLEINEAVKCLFLKWCNPIINDMKAIFDNLLLDFNDKIVSLYDKYKVTYEEVTNNINESKSSLSNMMKSLKGNEEDTKAINELSNLLRGDSYEGK